MCPQSFHSELLGQWWDLCELAWHMGPSEKSSNTQPTAQAHRKAPRRKEKTTALSEGSLRPGLDPPAVPAVDGVSADEREPLRRGLSPRLPSSRVGLVGKATGLAIQGYCPTLNNDLCTLSLHRGGKLWCSYVSKKGTPKFGGYMIWSFIFIFQR